MGASIRCGGDHYDAIMFGRRGSSANAALRHDQHVDDTNGRFTTGRAVERAIAQISMPGRSKPTGGGKARKPHDRPTAQLSEAGPARPGVCARGAKLAGPTRTGRCPRTS